MSPRAFLTHEIDTEALAGFGYKIGTTSAGRVYSIRSVTDSLHFILHQDERFPIILDRCLLPMGAVDNSGMGEG